MSSNRKRARAEDEVEDDEVGVGESTDIAVQPSFYDPPILNLSSNNNYSGQPPLLCSRPPQDMGQVCFMPPNPPPNNIDTSRPEPIDPELGLDSVGALNEQIKYMKNNIMFALKQQKTLKENWGYEPEKGIIFHGPPGTGKTLLAKAFVAELNHDSETKTSFFMRKGTDVFNKYFGETEKNIRELFQAAVKAKPSVIFFDELDGLCPNRVDSQHQFYTNVVTTLLGEIDNLKRGEVFLIGATNRLESIDPALRRPGRFGKELLFNPPNEDGRVQILNVHLKKWKKQPTKEIIEHIAKLTSGFTGADLEQLCRHAFDIARERVSINQNGDYNINELEKMQVTPEDWDMAINTTKRSDSNVFGNTYFTGVDLTNGMKPLLGPIASEIKDKLVKNYIDGGQCSEEPDIKMFHIYWQNDESYIKILNQHIYPAVLQSIDTDKFPTFILSLSALGLSGNPLMYIKHLFSQIQSCFKKKIILYIPSLDILYSNMDQRTKDTFANCLESTRGRKKNILMTSARADLTTLFYSIKFIDVQFAARESMEMRKPSKEEIKSFFETILVYDSKRYGTNTKVKEDLKKTLKDTLDLVVKYKTVETTLNLYGKYANHFNKFHENTTGGSKTKTKHFKDLIDGLNEELDALKNPREQKL